MPSVQNQPVGHNSYSSAWMQTLAPNPNCPPGLQYLSQVDQLLIHQQHEILEVITGFETNNKYEIKNSMGQRVYFATEENDCCNQYFCGSARSFTITVVDNTSREVMRFTRPLRCNCCCTPCCLQKLEVQAPPGITVGYVIQKWHPYLPRFTIQNEREQSLMKIIGPCVLCSCCSDIDFEVKSLDDTKIGRISKQWSGFVNEMFTDADNFGIQFPLDLDVKIKAVMLGACFLIDFMFFEHTEHNN
ncbi:phospholipid scramblase 1-like [Pelodytes ibericus]